MSGTLRWRFNPETYSPAEYAIPVQLRTTRSMLPRDNNPHKWQDEGY